MSNKKMLNTFKTNVFISEFNFSLVGMSIWTLIGMMDIPIYASVLKLSGMIGAIIAGYVQKTVAHYAPRALMQYTLRCELLSTMIYSVGNMLLPFNFPVGMCVLIVGRIIHGIMCGVGAVHRDRVLDYIYPDVIDRSRFKGEIKMFQSTGNSIGLGVNLMVFAITLTMGINQINVIKWMIFTHGALGVIDLIVSIYETKVVNEFYTAKGIIE